MGKQVSQYDKILKENIEAVIPGLMQHILGITAVDTEEIPDDIQHTKERKPDVLKKITDSAGSTFILQVEFQTANDTEMIYRMAEYHVMLERKYKLPVRQFVIFLGPEQPSMATELAGTHLQFRYPLIWFAQLDYEHFLHSAKVEEVLLSVLGDFKGDSEEQVLRRILARVEETSSSSFALQRHFNQLRVLSQLRNLGVKLKEVMDSIAKYINEEKDALYLRGFDKGEARGEERGEQKAETRFVQNLLGKLSLSDEQIADIAGVSVEFVLQVKQASVS